MKWDWVEWLCIVVIALYLLLIAVVIYAAGVDSAGFKVCQQSGGTYIKKFDGYVCMKLPEGK